jgi:hypothetical protein
VNNLFFQILCYFYKKNAGNVPAGPEFERMNADESRISLSGGDGTAPKIRFSFFEKKKIFFAGIFLILLIHCLIIYWRKAIRNQRLYNVL